MSTSTSLQQANAIDLDHAPAEVNSLPPPQNDQNPLTESKTPDPPAIESLQVDVTPSHSLDTAPETISNASDSPKEILTDSDNDTKKVCGIYLRSQKSKLFSSTTKCSRTGDDYQVISLPEAGSYKKETRNSSVMPQKIWDPTRAKKLGLDDFVQLYCPKNKKEIAMMLLHRRNYKITGFLEALEEIPPTDGSEWTGEERDNFLSLLRQNKYNFNKTAKAMDKSVSNCMTVYYNVIHVRKTRSRRRREKLDRKKQFKDDIKSKLMEPTENNIETPSDSKTDESAKKRMRSETDDTTSGDEKSVEPGTSQGNTNSQTSSSRRRSKRIKVTSDEEKGTLTKATESSSEMKESETNVKSPEKQPAEEKSSQETPLESEKLPEKEHEIRRSARLGATSSSSSSTSSATSGMKKRATRMEPRKLPTRKVSAARKASSTRKAASAKINNSERSHLDTPNTNAQDEQWEKTLKTLVKFKEENGHCLVPKIYPENQNLSYWVFRQRGFYWKRQKNVPTSLTEERIKKLTDIGFMFRVKNTKAQGEIESLRRQPKLDKKWDNYYKQLIQYKEENGDCLVPKIYKKNRPLASWVFNQRHQYRLFSAGKKSLLNPDRINTLESIGFIWNAKKSKEWKEAERNRKQASVEGIWQGHYRNLVAYKKKHGTTRVPKKYSVNQALSTWVFRQRAQYRLKMNGQVSNLSDDRLKLLKEVEFTFRVNDW